MILNKNTRTFKSMRVLIDHIREALMGTFTKDRLLVLDREEKSFVNIYNLPETKPIYNLSEIKSSDDLLFRRISPIYLQEKDAHLSLHSIYECKRFQDGFNKLGIYFTVYVEHCGDDNAHIVNKLEIKLISDCKIVDDSFLMFKVETMSNFNACKNIYEMVKLYTNEVSVLTNLTMKFKEDLEKCDFNILTELLDSRIKKK